MAVVEKDNLAKLRIDRSGESQAPQRKRFGLIFVLLIVIVLVGGGAWFWSGGGDISERFAVPEALRSRIEVRVERAQVKTGRSGDATVVATGYLESRRQAKIGARAPGRIQSVHVEEGSRVSDQQILAVLEHADLDASLAAAEAVLQQAKAQLLEQDVQIQRTGADLERAEALRQRSGISTAEFDRIRYEHDASLARQTALQASVTLAEARVREAEQLRENMFIRASFDGTVISKDAEVGESILPGGMGEASGRGSVVTIADLDHLEVECDVKEDFISRIRPGRAAEVAVDAVPDRRYQARVRKIIPMGDRARATIKVQVEILNADDRLFPEMSATVYFLPDETQQAAPDGPRVFCSTDAIVDDGEGAYVLVVTDDDRVQRVDVVTSEAVQDGIVEIRSGLQGNERCVVKPPPDLSTGDLVEVSE